MNIEGEFFADKMQLARMRKGSRESIMLHVPGTRYVEKHGGGLERVDVIINHSRKQNGGSTRRRKDLPSFDDVKGIFRKD